MSIASRIDNMYDNVDKAYKSINKLGVVLTDVDKNIENISPLLDNFYDTLPKVTGTGETLTLNNTSEAPMKIDLKGNTQQDSTTGKQLLNFTDTTFTDYNVQTIIQNGIITLNGTPSSQSYNHKIYTYTATQSGTYTLLPFKSSTNSNIRLIYKINGGSFINGDTNPQISLSNEDVLEIHLRIDSTNTITNFVVKPMLYLGTNETNWEPYTGGIPSPNPDYPQPIHIVSGDNTIEICGKNLFDKNNPRIVNRLPADGGSITTGSNYVSSYLPAKEGDIFTLSTQSNLLDTYASIYFVSEELNNATTWLARTQRRGGATSITATAPQNTKYVCFYMIYSNNQTTINSLLETIQVEKSNEATTYESYTGNTQLISLGVENLFDKDNATIEIGTIGPNGSLDYSTARLRAYYFEVKENTKYTISTSSSDLKFVPYYYNSSKTFISYDNGWKDFPYTFTTPANTKYLALLFKNSTDTPSVDMIGNLQLEKGSKANSYSEYGKEPIELCKIGDYQDYIYKDNGTWYLHKEIGKVVLDGSENWVLKSTYQGINQFQITKTDVYYANDNVSRILSNYYKGVKYTNSWTIDYSITIADNLIRIMSSTISTKEAFQTWLQSHNTSVYYVLATPTDTEITDETLIGQLDNLQNLNSYNPTTNIMQENNDKPFILDVTALKVFE